MNILKTIFSITFVIEAVFVINRFVSNYSNEGMLFIGLSLLLFLLHLFAWIAPKTFFNICWKITKFLPDRFDYDASYRNLEITSMGVLIAADIFLGIGFLIVTLPK